MQTARPTNQRHSANQNKLRRSRGPTSFGSSPLHSQLSPDSFPKMPLIQLQPHPFTDLPAHPSLPSGPARPEARQVANTALQEALQLLNSDLPTWEKDSKPRRSPPAYAEIRLSRKWRRNEKDTNSSAKQKPEFWVCRQSEHHDANVVGSAPWSEFEDGLRSEHAEHEMEYTPSVTGVERLLQWTEQEIGELEILGVTFRDVDLEGELTESIVSSNQYFTNANSSKSHHPHIPPNSSDISALLHLIHHLRHIRCTQQRTLLSIGRLHDSSNPTPLRSIHHTNSNP